ncbi:MAG: flagellar basal body-associated protein FliL [Clostridiaceae bacterium]|nr:flagellar basal body-associated protein FliL [Clostridiaceae bacterium]
MESRSIYTVLLAIIAVLALALAVLVIFLFVSYNPNHQVATNIEGMSERVVPDEEMIEFKLFDGEERMFALKSEPENPDSIVMVSVTIKCDAGEKRKKETDITNRVNQYMSELEEAVGDYFANITLSEAKLVETRYKARDDLLNIFNDIINANKSEKEKIIYKVTLQMFPQ